MNLWLDDVRDPRHYGAIGFVWVKTIDEAKELLATGDVKHASLDHDLGACDLCMTVERNQTDGVPWGGMAPHCRHFGTGADLCLWMAESGHWPTEKPQVHSANPVGAKHMRGIIDRYFGTKMGDPR